MNKPLLFIAGVIILLVGTVFGTPIVMYREYRWRSSPHYKLSQRLQALSEEFDRCCQHIVETHGKTDLSIRAVKELCGHARYVELTQRRVLMSQLMTVCRRVLPKDVFKKNEMSILYFVKMSLGLVMGKRIQAPAAELFTRAESVEDVVVALIQVGVITESVFKERFSLFDVEDVQGFLSMHVQSFKCNYEEPASCG